MLGWLLRLLLLFLLVRALMLIVGGLLRGLLGVPQGSGASPGEAARGPARAGHGPQSRGTLVQDPVCGTYILQERALTARTSGGGTAFFCSEACRSAYDAQAARAR